MRPFRALLFALTLAGCAAGPAVWPVQPVPLQAWRPPTQITAQIVALHGFNDHKGAFAEFAQFAAESGVLVRAYDQPGFGATAERGFWPGSERLAQELFAQIEAARMAHPETPLFVLGESMGAAVAVASLTRPDAPPVDGLLLSAPAVWGGGTLNPFYRATLRLVSGVFPGMSFTGRSLGILASDNLEMLRELGRDPLYIKATRADAIAGLVALMDAARERASAIDGRTLILTGAKDQVVRPEFQLSFASRVGTGDCTLLVYPEGWHLLLRDLQRQTVWDDILAWVQQAPLPSYNATSCDAGDTPVPS
jgi:acylglycerol lipase